MIFILKIFSIIIISFAPVILLSDERIFGIWKKSDGETWDILDGFKVSTGPILVTETNGELSTGIWTVNSDKSISVSVGYSTRELTIPNLSTIKWGESDVLTKDSETVISDKIFLKDDPSNFINKLTGLEWTSKNSPTSEFSTTFSNESGVLINIDTDGVISPTSWSIASDVLKISSEVIIKAFITEKYMIGLTSEDRFLVYKSIGVSKKRNKTSMVDKKDLFFDTFLTGSWERNSWNGKDIISFRPIYGELKGKKLTFNNNRLIGHSNWEFSPATGALEIGYTEYLQGTIVGNTLALLDDNGDQLFYTRNEDSALKRYTLSDVKTIPLNENSLNKIEKELSGQFQYEKETYLFEFMDDKRTGFVHKFKSSPFTITGETFKPNEILSDASVLYVLEDIILFEDKIVFKRDSSFSRLKPKSEDEVKEDKVKEENRIELLGTKQVNAIITFLDGKKLEIPLGFETLDKITKIELISQ